MVPPANCFTVLVVDDMLPNRVLLSKVLKGAGYGVLEAVDGLEALALLKDPRRPVDLVVTDIEMPGMDGIAFVDQLRALDAPVAKVPVIAASGNADDEMRDDAMDAGCDVFLTKPFDLAVLRREIGALLRASRQAVAVRETAPAGLKAPNRIQSPVRELK
ncbi:MAG TPA: response regulator, partial [Bacteroidia bacterium]|nr:response regulator [Bacteroidia bacterium]